MRQGMGRAVSRSARLEDDPAFEFGILWPRGGMGRFGAVWDAVRIEVRTSS